jgi:hypothetical protein
VVVDTTVAAAAAAAAAPEGAISVDGFSDGFNGVGGEDNIDSTILGMPDDKDDDDDDVVVVNVDFLGDVNGTRRFV